MTAREKFQIGDRVQRTTEIDGRARRYSSFGTVTGFVRDGSVPRHGVRVRRDDSRYSYGWHPEEWQVVDRPGPRSKPKRPDLDRVARKLVTALYLYPGYRVDARGPAGCIMDALDEIAPDVAAELRETVDAGEVFQRRWGEDKR